MTEEKPFDLARSLSTAKGRANYIDACVEAGGTDMLPFALYDCVKAYTIARLHKETGMSESVIRKAVSGEGRPTVETIARILDGLGVEVHFRPIATRKGEA